MVNALGTFTPSYFNPTYGVVRLASMAMPNGAVPNYQWETNAGDFRLKQSKPGSRHQTIQCHLSSHPLLLQKGKGQSQSG